MANIDDPNVTTLTGLSVQPDPNGPTHVLSIPQVGFEAINDLNTGEVRNGSIYYDPIVNAYFGFTTYINAANGGTAFDPLCFSTLLSMTAAQGVFFEASASNMRAGVMYVQSDTNSIRIFNGAAWRTIQTA